MLVASPALGTVALGTLDVTDELSPSTLALGSDAPEETLPPPLPPFSSVAGAALKACGYRTERDPRRSTRRTNNADVGVCLISTSSTPASTAKQSARFVRADNRPEHLGSGAPVCRQHGHARTTHTKHFLARQVVRARAGLLGALQHLREEHYLDQFCTNGAPPPGPITAQIERTQATTTVQAALNLCGYR
jgi:hypothetical protein